MIHREQDIIQWGIDRNIIGPASQSNKKKQCDKTLEEVIELRDSIILDWVGVQEVEDQKPHARDAIGDIIVTLVLQAQMWGLTITECLDAAWDEIKDRKGKMVDGIFVKEPNA